MYMARRPEVLWPYLPVDEERALGSFHVAVPVRQRPRGEAEGRLLPPRQLPLQVEDLLTEGRSP
jgi:hypothetical protein